MTTCSRPSPRTATTPQADELPGHIQIFNCALRSYRDLPFRLGEFGQCHRNEPSGSLHGMMRVRGFTQDDGHIFCTEDQILAECEAFTKLVKDVYQDFGFTEIATRSPRAPKCASVRTPSGTRPSMP